MRSPLFQWVSNYQATSKRSGFPCSMA